ncbi:MAG: SpoIIE family protein phosphatase [Planctomycetes bacterium]|nr:SpoIIE family protein phosphatase [Planctomycetota bacterium]
MNRRRRLGAALEAVMEPLRSAQQPLSWAALENDAGAELARWSAGAGGAPTSGPLARFELPPTSGEAEDLRLVVAAACADLDLAELGPWAAHLCAQLLQREHELEDLAAALGRCFEERAALVELAAELSHSSSEEELCAALACRSAELVAAPRAFLALRELSGFGYLIAGAHGFERAPAPRHELERGLTGVVLREGAPCWIEDVLDFPPEGLAPFEERARRSLLLVPLAARGASEALGVLGVLDAGGERGLTGEDERLLGFLAEHAAAVIGALRRRASHAEARAVGAALLALGARPAGSAGTCTLGWAHAAAPHGGAELAERWTLPGGACALALLSTSARGTLAAARLAGARMALRAILANESAPERALISLHAALSGELAAAGELLGATLVLLEHDGSLRAAVAGHPAPLVRRSETRAIEVLGIGGPMLGLEPSLCGTPEGAPASLRPGDALVLLSAGAALARGPRSAVTPGALVQAALERVAQRTAPELAEALLRELELRAGAGRCEDRTIVVARRDARPEIARALCSGASAESGA